MSQNKSMTGMTDDAFYGRDSAPSIDLDACRRAAIREARRAYDQAIAQSGRRGALLLRRAVYRLAIAFGNQAEAESYLSSAPLPTLTNIIHDDELRDRDELERALQRTHRHPQLVQALRDIESQLAEL